MLIFFLNREVWIKCGLSVQILEVFQAVGPPCECAGAAGRFRVLHTDCRPGISSLSSIQLHMDILHFLYIINRYTGNYLSIIATIS
jgi:hypothetical protein